MNNPTQPPAVINLRAFLAYCEGQAPSAYPFALIPYADAIAANIPFSITFSHEGNDWAVFIAGDCSPHDTIALEKAGVIEDADDERQEIAGGFENETPALILPAVTSANVERLMDYVRKNDREGAIGFNDCLRDCETLADVHNVLHGVLLTRFHVDIIENSGTSYDPIKTENLEDRNQAIETLHRYGFGSPHFDSAFPSVMAYALHNVSPQE